MLLLASRTDRPTDWLSCLCSSLLPCPILRAYYERPPLPPPPLPSLPKPKPPRTTDPWIGTVVVPSILLLLLVEGTILARSASIHSTSGSRTDRSSRFSVVAELNIPLAVCASPHQCRLCSSSRKNPLKSLCSHRQPTPIQPYLYGLRTAFQYTQDGQKIRHSRHRGGKSSAPPSRASG